MAVSWAHRFCFVGGLIAAAAPLAAQPTVSMSIDPPQAYLNEAVQVTIEVINYRSCEPPEFPDLADATVREVPGTFESRQVSIINGRITEFRSRRFEYELTPHAVGEVLIPPVAVTVDGQVYRTQATRLRVRPSDADQLLFVEITTGRQRVYVGQRIAVTMTVWVKPAVDSNQQRWSPLEMFRRIVPLNYGPFRADEIANRQNVGRTREIDGQRELYYAFDHVATVVPSRPGLLTFDEIEVGIAYPTSRGGTRNLRQHPTVEPTEVVPVPMEDRPPNFAGAVGVYDIETTAHPTSVRVGDPIELTIEILGDGPVDTLPPPLLASDERLTQDFRVPDQELAGEVYNGRRRFSITIRARRDDVTEIPAIEYPYFDPDAERFVSARSQPIPLDVAPAAEVETPEPLMNLGPRNGTSATALQALDGLHDIETNTTHLLATTPTVAPRIVTGAMFGPPAAFLVLWAVTGIAHRRSADPGRRRRQAALRTARRRIAAVRGQAPREEAAEIAAALASYLADRLDEPPARFVGRAALEYLREQGVRPELVARWEAVLARCEEASFGGGSASADDETLARQALHCLAALQRVRL